MMNILAGFKVWMIVFVVIICSLLSCTKADGDWDDIINLSKSEIAFHAESDSIVITTEGDWWWVSDVSLNGDFISMDSIDTTSDNFEIINADFVIQRRSLTELFVRMNKNISNDERNLRIGMQAGNYFETIIIVQDSN